MARPIGTDPIEPVATPEKRPTLLGKVAEVLRPWLPWLTAIWLLGVVVFSLRPIWGWLHVRRLQRQGLSPLADPIRQMCVELMQKMGVHRAVQMAQSVLVEVPTVVGHLRPLVLLPASP